MKKRSFARILTDSEKAEAVARYKRGQSIEFIWQALELPRRQVSAAIHEAGVKVPKFGRRQRDFPILYGKNARPRPRSLRTQEDPPSLDSSLSTF